MLQKLKIAAIAAGVAFAPMAANALIVTHTFSGEVTTDRPGAASDLYEVGDTAEVVLQYDSAAPGFSGSPTNYKIDNIIIRFGNYVATTERGFIRIGDNIPLSSDQADIIFIQTLDLIGPAIGGEFYDKFNLEFAFAADTFSGETLPTFLPQVSSIFSVTNRGVLSDSVLGFSDMRVETITTVVGATVVPLPAALPLFLSAFGCLALIRVRRKTVGARGHVNGLV